MLFLLFALFYVLSLRRSIDFGPRIVVFEAVILLPCCLLLSLFYVVPLQGVLCCVLGLWCLKRYLCCHVVCCCVCIVLCALIALEYCVGSSDCGV